LLKEHGAVLEFTACLGASQVPSACNHFRGRASDGKQVFFVKLVAAILGESVFLTECSAEITKIIDGY
jgi:hypothetical protein